MKKVSILGVLLLLLSTISAQVLPCEDFNSGPGNWVGVNSNTFMATHQPADGTTYYFIDDHFGASTIENTVDYNNLGTRFPGFCLCFDIKMFNPADGPTDINPQVHFYNGNDKITFKANVTINTGSPWVKVCAPIEFSNPVAGIILPNNADGQWLVPASVPSHNIPTYFNNVMRNVTKVEFDIDNQSSLTTEEFGFDNICVVNCNNEEITHSEVSCMSAVLNLYCWVDDAQSYAWTYPNGQTSTSQFPVVSLPIGASRKAYEGWYTCYVTLANGDVRVLKTYVHVPEDCCEGEIQVDVSNCTNYTFDFSSFDVDVHCMIWRLNDEVVSYGNQFSTTLSAGTHEICINYLGVNSQTGEICCEEKCTTVVVPEVEIIDRTIEKCEIDNYWYNPCDEYSDFATYTISSSTSSHPGYHSNSADRIGQFPPKGCIAHNLVPGQYTFQMIDENGCLVRTLNVTVVEVPLTTTSCTNNVILNCGDDLDLTTYQICEECDQTGNGTWTSWFVEEGENDIPVADMIYNITQPVTYKKVYEDLENCVRCTIEVDVTVIRVAVSVTEYLSEPCEEDYTLAQINQLVQQHNFALCGGNYSEFMITETDASGNSLGYVIDNSNSMTFRAGHSYVITPTDPMSCCELHINFLCNASSMPMNDTGENDHENGIDAPSDWLSPDNVPAVYKLVPNPTSRKFQIIPKDTEISSYDHVSIIDPLGRVIVKIVDAKPDEYYDLKHQASGTYFVTIKSGKDEQTLRLILNE